jgi:hypothetical protein
LSAQATRLSSFTNTLANDPHKKKKIQKKKGKKETHKKKEVKMKEWRDSGFNTA